MAIKIDKKVPIPPKHPRKGTSKYPFSSMEVGDSFWCPLAIKSLHSIINHRRKKGTDRNKYTTRTENGGTRTWRIK